MQLHLSLLRMLQTATEPFVFRSNKGAVGNSVTTILHNNYSEKPLTPKSSNQRPSFKYVLKDPDIV